MSMYHEGQRVLQDRFDGRRLSDVLEAHRRHDTFTDADAEMIRSAPFFFLATAHGDSVDCSIKGGNPGFVRITGPGTLEFPDYDGNSMFRSLGNILRSPAVGLLFVRFDGSSTKLRINGRAEIVDDPAVVAAHPGAKMVVRVTAQHIYPNCPRYVPDMATVAPSKYAPAPGRAAPPPEWKSRDYIQPALPADWKKWHEPL